MNLKPKRLGDELSLDDYNACQYLLYRMDCWTDSILIDSYISKDGKFATYKLLENPLLETEKQEHYRLIGTPTASTKFEIELSNIESKIKNLHISAQITLYYKSSETFKDGAGNTTSLDVTDPQEVPIWGANEAKETEYLETHYKKLIVPATYDNENQILSFSLFDKNDNTIAIESIISKRIFISYKFNTFPYIDFRNGKANLDEEILVDNVEELQKLVENVPRNNSLVVFRLDSNIDVEPPVNANYAYPVGTYFLTKPIEIQEGQNIEIRGGTRDKARINASLSKRCFIIHPGGKLRLYNIACEYGQAKYATYDVGRGGAILVGYGYNTFGILECEYCTFLHNTANYGGAIFSYHAGLHLKGCTFDGNSCLFAGGGVYYQARDVTMKVANVLGKVGETVQFEVIVTTLNGGEVNEGDVDIYLKSIDGIHIGTGRVRSKVVNGKRVGVMDALTYTLPSEVKTIEYPIIAVYNGGRGLDNDIATANLKIKVPEKYTISWVSGNVTTAKVGDVITLNAKVVGNGGVISTAPVLAFKIGDNIYQAQKNGNMYTITYKVAQEDMDEEKKTIAISMYAIANDDYTSNTLTTTITVDMEEEEQHIEGYMTGLYVNGNTPITEEMLQGWISNKITDVYVRFRYSNNVSSSNATKLEALLKKDEYKNKIRFHVALNVLYDTTEQKWYSTTDTSRINSTKNEIKYVKNNFSTCAGINLDYVRYSGGKNSATTETRVKQVNEVYKTLKEYIKSLNENYIISTSVKAEDDANTSYYGQDLKAICDYVDYIQPMIYKEDYSSWSKYEDSWVISRLEYIINLGVSVDKIMVALQGYKSSGGKYSTIDIDEYTGTVRKISVKKVKGVALFREGLVPSKGSKKYLTKSLAEIMEET